MSKPQFLNFPTYASFDGRGSHITNVSGPFMEQCHQAQHVKLSVMRPLILFSTHCTLQDLGNTTSNIYVQGCYQSQECLLIIYKE